MGAGPQAQEQLFALRQAVALIEGKASHAARMAAEPDHAYLSTPSDRPMEPVAADSENLEFAKLMAEIVRAGVESTPRGQVEAGVSLALSRAQVFLHVVLPPALARVWPALVSQIVIVMLGSAVCGQIATQELSYFANLIQSRNFRAFESYIVATLLYLALAVALRRLLNWAGPRWLFGR